MTLHSTGYHTHGTWLMTQSRSNRRVPQPMSLEPWPGERLSWGGARAACTRTRGLRALPVAPLGASLDATIVAPGAELKPHENTAPRRPNPHHGRRDRHLPGGHGGHVGHVGPHPGSDARRRSAGLGPKNAYATTAQAATRERAFPGCPHPPGRRPGCAPTAASVAEAWDAPRP
jgi:hypothetical protein